MCVCSFLCLCVSIIIVHLLSVVLLNYYYCHHKSNFLFSHILLFQAGSKGDSVLLAELVHESHDSQKGSCDDGLLCRHYYKERTSIHVFVHESVCICYAALSLSLSPPPPSLPLPLRSSRPTSGERTGSSVVGRELGPQWQ